jgi:hypothetical protein
MKDQQNNLKGIWSKSGKLFVSFFTVAAFLPVVLLGVMNKDKLILSSQADTATDLRIWIEPARVYVKSGQKLQLEVYGSYLDKNKLIPMVKTQLEIPEGIRASQTEINYKEAFAGRTLLGVIEVTAIKRGTYEININSDAVFTGLPSLPIVTSHSTLTVN